MLGKVLRGLLSGKPRPPELSAQLKDSYAELAAGRHAQAKSIAARLLAAHPQSYTARLLLAQACAALGETSSALDYANQCIASDPSNLEAYYVRGMIYEATSRPGHAMADFDRVLEIDADHVAALDHKGGLHDARGEFEASLACAERLIRLEPGNAQVHHKMAVTMRELGRLPEAEHALRQALSLDPGFHTAQAHLSLVLIELGRFDEAQQTLTPLLAQAPRDQNARWAAAVLDLLNARYETGWDHYEARESQRDPKLRPADIPEWDGLELTSGALFINAEQGLGDQIMFASCMPDALALAPSCIVSCDPRLEPMFRRSFPAVRVVPMQPDRPLDPAAVAPLQIRAQTMMGSLPGRFRRSREHFPRHAGYLAPDPDALASWRERLATLGPGKKIGISWTGGTPKTRRNLRSLQLEQLLPVLSVEGCEFVSLQYTDSRQEIDTLRATHGIRIHEYPEAIATYDETAALVGALDLVISVCTAVIHLSGALGKPVWVMVPWVPEWRYMREGEEMPWYPSVRLWRQTRQSYWPDVFASIAAELDRTVRPATNIIN
jgi:tetratricopeptide (TPR) repeat protein